MSIIEFLHRNPLFDVYDLETFKTDGKYDETALNQLDSNNHNDSSQLQPI